MANTLFKKNIITGEPGTAGSPATPGRPATNGRWVRVIADEDQAKQTATWLLIAAYQSGAVTDAQFTSGMGEIQTTVLGESIVWVPGTSEVPGTPGTPGTESTLVTDLNVGWNAGARSAQSEAGPFAVEFTFSEPTVAATAGINNSVDSGAKTSEIGWGFEYKRGAVRVFERDTFIVITPATVSAGAVFKIVRDGAGVITYFIDDVLVYTSLILCFGVAFLDGLIYSADSE